MRRRVALLPVLLLLLAPGCRRYPRVEPLENVPDPARIRADVAWLADDAREGRGTGTPGDDSTAAWLVRRYQAMDVPPGVPGYVQEFTARSVVAAHTGGAGLRTRNVVARIPGTDPRLAGQWIVIGAHYDHLGRSTTGAADPEAGDAIRNGADDNASGTAAVLELARLLRKYPLRRGVMFVHFGAEELGLLGAQHFVANSPVAVDSIQAMVNFDMVGRLRDDRVIVNGVATARELRAMLDSANARERPPLAISAVGDGFGPSDHSAFYAKGVPVLHFFTNVHEDYHRATDDAERVNAEGTARIVGLAFRVVRELGDRSAKLVVQRSAQPPAMGGARAGSDVWLGSVPDMAAGDAPGLRLAGVTPGSPADVAGLREGDVIVEFDGKPVTDLFTYTDALYARKPGDMVTIVAVRGGERRTFTVTLGRRGQRSG